MTVPVAVVGASGYVGAELVRLLLGHPHVEIASLCGDRTAGQRIDQVFPQFAGRLALPVEVFDPDRVARRAQIAFCALPHHESAAAVAELSRRELAVIDLSAGYRLRDPALYAMWYASGQARQHPAPQLCAGAVYGLPELHRDKLAGARLIAVPGCYPTAAILAVGPLVARGLVEPGGLVVDGKSGVSGAGRSPAQATHFAEAGEGVRVYKIAGTHRHTPEMEQELTSLAGAPVRLTFTPHLLPMTRGILVCVYAAPTDPSRSAAAYRAALIEAYGGEPFVTVLEPGQWPDTAHVRRSNRAHVAVAYDERAERIIALAAIDNLVKGAAGQAIQCMNVSRGWDESAGLGAVGTFP